MVDTSKPRGLGRGLSALLADAGGGESPQPPDRMVPVEYVKPNPEQPRRTFNQSELEELAESIRARGIVQPLIVRPAPDGDGVYQIVAGERRWRAAQLARLHEIPVLIRDYSDSDALEIALLENIQRTDLNPIEEGRAYRQLMDRFGHTQEELARQLGKSRSHLANSMRLLNLPEDVIEHVADGRISAGHARALLSVPNPSLFAMAIIDEGLSVRAVEARIKKNASGGDAAPAAKSTPKPTKDADTVALERDLSMATGLKVTVDWSRETGKGSMKLSFVSLEQLDWLCERLG